MYHIFNFIIPALSLLSMIIWFIVGVKQFRFKYLTEDLGLGEILIWPLVICIFLNMIVIILVFKVG
jgi:hypothetical protein